MPNEMDMNTNTDNSEMQDQMTPHGRGFASMDPETVSRIASQGGKAAHASGHAHEWTSEEAREAGRKGGLNSHRGGI